MDNDIDLDILREMHNQNVILEEIYKKNNGLIELLKYILLILVDVHEVDLSKFDSKDEEEDDKNT